MDPCYALGKASGVQVEPLARNRSLPGRARSQTEQPIAGSYQARVRRVHKRLEMLSVMVAPADRGFLLYTAEIPPEHEEAFAASAAARYAGYEETVARILARGGLDLARGVDQRGSSNSSEDSSD
jgi:hypothetical protein